VADLEATSFLSYFRMGGYSTGTENFRTERSMSAQAIV
jgi:hypothetical protein